MKIAIIGASDLGRSILHYARNNCYNIEGFYDDYSKGNVDGCPILGKIDNILTDYKDGKITSLVCAIGYKHFLFRQQIFEFYNKQHCIPFANIIDKSCNVDSSAILGQGVVIFPGTLVDKGVTLEDNVLLNVCVTVAHDSKIKAHTFLSPRVAVAGFSTIGSRCMIGINSTIIDNVNICDDTRIGGGAVVTKSIEKVGLYVGVPATWKKI